ncbi:MAG: GGDEF domain-containing protein [Terracidiphilus sp.]|jgi:diguanylate cyclase (GGDEF)-like protein
MISIKRYLEQTETESSGNGEEREPSALLPAAVGAYRSALVEMGNSGRDACPVLGEELQRELGKLAAKLDAELCCKSVKETEAGVREQLQGWGRRTALHYRQKTSEVKELLLVMARAAESVGERDQRCAQQITEVTKRLKSIANLEDLTQIRASIKQSASDLKGSIDRMTAEGKAAIDQLRAEVTNYQTRLEEAEEIASRDSLTGLSSRLWEEGQIEYALLAAAPCCVALIDINEFKKVNDEHGHMVGDEVLKQFAGEMRSACRSTDAIGRWGGDEFMLLLNNCGMAEAKAQIDRLREWVCGNYTVQGSSGPMKLRVDASIGLAERQPGETMKELVHRADAEMYRDKAASRAAKSL